MEEFIFVLSGVCESNITWKFVAVEGLQRSIETIGENINHFLISQSETENIENEAKSVR